MSEVGRWPAGWGSQSGAGIVGWLRRRTATFARRATARPRTLRASHLCGPAEPKAQERGHAEDPRRRHLGGHDALEAAERHMLEYDLRRILPLPTVGDRRHLEAVRSHVGPAVHLHDLASHVRALPLRPARPARAGPVLVGPDPHEQDLMELDGSRAEVAEPLLLERPRREDPPRARVDSVVDLAGARVAAGALAVPPALACDGPSAAAGGARGGCERERRACNVGVGARRPHGSGRGECDPVVVWRGSEESATAPRGSWTSGQRGGGGGRAEDHVRLPLPALGRASVSAARARA